MSVQYEMHCRSCNKTWSVSTGHDMLDGYKDNVVNHFTAPYRQKVADMIRDLPVPPYGFSHAIGTCPVCKEILSVPMIKAGERFFAQPCPICDGEVKIHEGKPEDLVCPLCGGTLEVKLDMFAD